MKLALDAMGGDNAPHEIVEGALLAVRENPSVEVILVGDEQRIKPLVAGRANDRISIYHASEVVGMEESPSLALRRKKDSSLRKAAELVRDGVSEGMVSAGNSGAMMAMGLFIIGKSPGVDRPVLATPMPSEHEPFLMLDMGANVDCSAKDLLHFALMGNQYARHILHRPKPRVALLSIGEEESKGNELTKEAFKLLSSEGSIDFTGNIEAKDMYGGKADVVVCDGFAGNVFLKASESVAELTFSLLKESITSSITAMTGYWLMKSALREFKKKVDYDEYGGAPLLGLKGSSVIAHGRAGAKAIKNAIKVAAEFSEKDVSNIISEELLKVRSEGDKVAAG